MIDLITTIAGSIPTTVTAVSLYKAAKPFLGKVLGPGAEELGEFGRDYIKGVRARTAAKTVIGAAKMLESASIEPHPVPFKTLLPLLENASLEEDDFLIDAWSALLANAANVGNKIEVEPGFCEILKQLSATQARVLKRVYDHLVPNLPKSEWLRKGLSKNIIMSEFLLSEEQYDIATDNLFRLQLCGNATNDYNGQITMMSDTKGAVFLLGYGYAFVNACTPPVAIKTNA